MKTLRAGVREAFIVMEGGCYEEARKIKKHCTNTITNTVHVVLELYKRKQ